MCKAMAHDNTPLGIILTVPPGTVGIPVLRSAADEGFKGMTVPFLKDLIDELELNPDPIPRTENDIVKFLLKSCLPCMTDEEYLARMLRRHTSAPKFKTSLDMNVLDACADVLGSSTTKEMREEIRTYVKQVEAAKLLTPKPVAKAKAAKKKKVWAPKDYESAAAAQAFKPPHPDCYLSLETEWHPRWKMSYPMRFPPYSFSSPYDPLNPATKRTALFAALKWAWTEFEEQKLGSCPFDFDA